MIAPMVKTVPILPATRNERDRMHWATRRRELDDWIMVLPMAQTENQQVKDDPPRRVEIVFSKTRGPESDTDNLFARCKSILDALQVRGWLYDDSPKYCKLEVREETRAPQRQTTIAVSVSDGESAWGSAA